MIFGLDPLFSKPSKVVKNGKNWKTIWLALLRVMKKTLWGHQIYKKPKCLMNASSTLAAHCGVHTRAVLGLVYQIYRHSLNWKNKEIGINSLYMPNSVKYVMSDFQKSLFFFLKACEHCIRSTYIVGPNMYTLHT